MPKIDIDNYIEQSGMRKARFGGYEPEDVHQAMEDLCADYEQHLTAMTSELRTLRQENDALRRHAQGLVMQNQTLSTQNATLAGQVDKLQSYRANLETQFSTVKERSHSLTNQVDMLRLKNSDLTRENKELTERCEEANSALRVKGRAHDQARQQVIADRDKVIADAEAEAARIRQQARDDADQILKDTNLKAEAIDQLAREQAIAQARKMVQSATDETREIQNAHRLRLQDLKSRISEMEKTRGEMMDYLAKMIEELQKTQEYASQNAPLVPHKEELAEADAEPRLDLSANKVDAAASALRGIELEADVMLKGTRVDGVYTADPEKDPAAEKFDEITFDEVYRRNLKVMDMTAFTLCRENGLRVIVFDMDTPGNLEKVLAGEKIGTLVKL